MEDAVEVEPLLGRDHEGLIDRGELQVAPGIRHQFAQLRLHGRHLDVVDVAEELAHTRENQRIGCADDLR